MPYEIRWIVPNKLLFVYVFGEITIADVAEMSQQSATSVEESPEIMVNSIIDVSQITTYPHNLLDLTRVINQLDLQQNKMGWALMIGINNPMLRFIVTTLTQLKKFRFRIVDDLSDALKFLHEIDESVPTQLPSELINITANQ